MSLRTRWAGNQVWGLLTCCATQARDTTFFRPATRQSPAYFSIDGGNTKLADFGQTSDPSDFLNSGVQGSKDPFDEYYSSSTIQNLTSVDKEFLDVLGFNLTAAPVATAIELAGATSLTDIANHYYLLDSSSAGPSLKYGGTDVCGR